MTDKYKLVDDLVAKEKDDCFKLCEDNPKCEAF